MNRDEVREYCLSMKGAVSEFPFGPDAEVFKVMGKMFALIPVSANTVSISLKCDPVLAEVLRENYAAVIPGYHLNKRHWNTVVIDGTIPPDEINEMIDNSYQLVVNGLTKKDRATLSQF